MKSIEKTVLDIVGKVAKVNPEEISLDSHISENLGVDSFSALEIIFMLEQKYEISIPDQEAGRITTVGELIELMSRLLKNE